MNAFRPAVTLRDIAEKARVSITTVSRILNRRDTAIPIKEETRQRVLAVAAELGYKPNLLARGLRGSRSSLLGVIARDIADPFHLQTLRGINEAAARRDYRMFLGHVDYQANVAIAYGSMFEQSHADGILLIGDIEGDEAALAALMKQHRFVVGLTDRVGRRQMPGVYADSVTGTHLALDHLWALGHRRIVCVTDGRIHDCQLRADVYAEYMRAHEAAAHVQVYLTAQDPEPSFQLGLKLFGKWNGLSGPTAIYAASDTIALGLLQAAYQTGVRVPEQVSLVGFDNIDLAPFTIPPLTTIDQDGVEMGRQAANLLIDMIEQNRERSEVDDLVQQPRLVVRQSTAPPKA
jgi:LacI family transcriptional regulator